MQRTTYTSEFRQEAVKIALSSTEPVVNTARNLGINESTLHNWVNRAMKEKTTSKQSTVRNSKNYKDLEKENRELQKKLKKAEMERDILKKAAAYFASQDL